MSVSLPLFLRGALRAPPPPFCGARFARAAKEIFCKPLCNNFLKYFATLLSASGGRPGPAPPRVPPGPGPRPDQTPLKTLPNASNRLKTFENALKHFETIESARKRLKALSRGFCALMRFCAFECFRVFSSIFERFYRLFCMFSHVYTHFHVFLPMVSHILRLIEYFVASFCAVLRVLTWFECISVYCLRIFAHSLCISCVFLRTLPLFTLCSCGARPARLFSFFFAARASRAPQFSFEKKNQKKIF